MCGKFLPTFLLFFVDTTIPISEFASDTRGSALLHYSIMLVTVIINVGR